MELLIELFWEVRESKHLAAMPLPLAHFFSYKQFVRSLFVEGTLQDALKAQPSLLPQRKAVERLCIMSYEMMVHVILSYPPPPPGATVFSDVHAATFANMQYLVCLHRHAWLTGQMQ